MKKVNFYFKLFWSRIHRITSTKTKVTKTVTIPRAESTKPSAGQGQIRTAAPTDLIRELECWLLKHYDFRFNLLTEIPEFKVKNAITASFIPADNRQVNGLCIDARKAGINCWDRDISRFINSSHIPTYHPFHHFINSLPRWDGNDRVTELAARVSGLPVWMDGFHRWMLAITAQWMGLDRQHGNSVAPVLVSSRQGKHKSTFCRMLVPDSLHAYYTDSFDLNASSGAEQKLAFFGLINLDEFDKFTPRKMALLKNVMQMANLNIKKAYKKSFSPLPRIASFIATSNQKELLTDPTGSRRFLCVEIENSIDCTPPDHAQLYAQLKAELLAGKRYWFTAEEEAAIMENNLPFQKRMIEEDVFFRCFRPANHEDKNPLLLTAAEIFAHLKKHNPSAMLQSSPVHFGRFLCNIGLEKIRRAQNTFYRVVEIAMND